MTTHSIICILTVQILLNIVLLTNHSNFYLSTSEWLSIMPSWTKLCLSLTSRVSSRMSWRMWMTAPLSPSSMMSGRRSSGSSLTAESSRGGGTCQVLDLGKNKSCYFCVKLKRVMYGLPFEASVKNHFNHFRFNSMA